jgi:hypothetical protein
LSRANLSRAPLTKANFSAANLTKADLSKAFAQDAHFSGAKLSKADLSKANLSGADLSDADLSKADLTRADLSGAKLIAANLSGADVGDVVFEPKPDSLPLLNTLVLARNLHKMKYQTIPIALENLRQKFKEAGMRNQVREITYAIQRSQRQASMRSGNYFEKLNGLFSFIFLELTCQYGRRPSNALFILVGFIFFFSIFYIFALKSKRPKTGIWLIFPRERVLKATKKERPFKLTAKFPPRTVHNEVKSKIKITIFRLCRMIKVALYFSLLSAFSIGFREFNVGNWFSRLQRREYLFKATGWVRTVSGFQSLLSVLLLALWVVTFLVGFLREFE